jgi:hypothetical protein
MSWIALLVLLAGQQPPLAKPAALNNFERARAQLRTGHLTCVVTGETHRVTMPVVQYSMQMARNGDVLYSYDGDPEGVFDRDPNGSPILVGRTQVLVQQEVAYGKNTFSSGGIVAPRSTWRPNALPGYADEKVDLRTLGMAPDFRTLAGQDAQSVLSHVAEGCTGYTEERDGTIHRITMTFPDDRITTYEIDEAKGWNATRISGQQGGSQWECVIDVQNVDGTWFPSHGTMTLDGQPFNDWVVTDAAFNTPSDPAGWKPADIGFEVGMMVSVQGSPADGKPRFWDGSKVVSREEIVRRFESGELQPGPTLRLAREGKHVQPGSEKLERLRLSAGVLTAFIGQWERYVIDFCEANRLNKDQVSRAYRYLHQTQDAAEKYLGHARERIEELQKRRDSGSLSAEKAKEEFAKIRAPVDDIFEKQLKPCLEKIPTRKQREAGPPPGVTTAPRPGP